MIKAPVWKKPQKKKAGKKQPGSSGGGAGKPKTKAKAKGAVKTAANGPTTGEEAQTVSVLSKNFLQQKMELLLTFT
jgi:hypothetical protein